MESAPESNVKTLRLTNTKVLAPIFLQRLQWHVPIMVGRLVTSNFTSPQQQLPANMTHLSF
ncbi:hypothetical protein P353_16840 [Comamonas testosteroni]|uniref:Uncharacterized protein n=1 Tax=Comamonas testosteroni TaxID=285 RepID=A0A096FDS2_COMTE|nr:hypothetical protein P353_16840 [Comamonas testosteroni]